MCGILAAISFHHKINLSQFKAALNTLDHRGPDASQIWVSKEGNVALGHRRLSIIDLETGNQPLSNQSESLHLVANGEFYDFERQRRALEKKGHRFKTKSDSEVALHLYEDLGASLLSELRGEFAFIIWDEENQLCFAAKDRFGIKPLFYTVRDKTLYLASEIKALLALGVSPKWDEDAMMFLLKSTLNIANQTAFKNIYQVPPGHYLLTLKDNVQLFKYWDFNYPKKGELRTLDTESYINGLRSELKTAIRLRLRADVPVACYLSGGLDSSSILGIAQNLSNVPISAFTLAFEQGEYDEEEIAAEMAEKAGAKFYPVPIKQIDLADHFEDAIWHGETFFTNGHGIAKYLLSRAVRDAGFKVVLTGEGADELFAGYPHFRVDQLFYGNKEYTETSRTELLHLLEKANQVSLGLLFPTNFNDSLPSVDKMLGFTPTWLLVAFDSANKFSRILSEDFKKNIARHDVFKTLLDTFDVQNQLKARDPLNQSLYLWSKLRLPSYLLTILGDRMEMAHSIEGRLPFLDHHVVEYMVNVPVDLKINEMTEKYLLREAARPFITKRIYERQKHPFLSPPASVEIDQPFHELLQSKLRSKTLTELPFIDSRKVIQLLDQLPKMDKKSRIAWDFALMIILSACVMHERFKM